MNQLLIYLRCLCITFAICVAAPVRSQSLVQMGAQTDGLYYNLYDDSTAELVKDESYKTRTSVDIPDIISINNTEYTVSAIGFKAFYFCNSLTSVTLPRSIKRINEYAFYWCTALTEIELPDGVTNIGEYAFSWCTNLKNFSLPERLTNIGEFAFYWCSGITGIIVPNEVTNIGAFAFKTCSNLTEISLPASVTNIGKSAFAYCNSLSTIICDAMTPPEIAANTFDSIHYADATLYVPEGAIDAYKASEYGWSNFVHIQSNASYTAIAAPESEETQPTRIYTLDGVPTNLSKHGLYIIRQGGHSRKVILR